MDSLYIRDHMDVRAAITRPFSLLELATRHAIASVLSRERWWTEWRDPPLRAQLLDAVQLEFIRKSFVQTQMRYEDSMETLRCLDMFLEEPYSAEKEELAAEWCRFVHFNREYQVITSAFRTARMRERSRDSVSESLDVFDPMYDQMHSYTFIEWYFTCARLRESLRLVPAELWTPDTLQPVLATAREHLDPSIVPQAVAFVRTALQNGITDQIISDLLKETETRPQVIAGFHLACERIQDELSHVVRYITQAIDHVIDSGALAVVNVAANEDCATISPAGVYGCWVSDTLVPSQLKAKFAQEMKVFEAKTKQERSKGDGQVETLVNPSMFPCVFGKTLRIPENAVKDPALFNGPADHMTRTMFDASTLVVNIIRGYYESGSGRGAYKRGDMRIKYQCIPTDFQVHDDGSVRMLTYINNVHPEEYADLSSSIEAIVGRFVPLFNRVLANARAIEEDTAYTRKKSGRDYRRRKNAMRTNNALKRQFKLPRDDEYNEERPMIPSLFVATEDVYPSSSTLLNGKRIQVIVKVDEIVLTPETPRYDGDEWQIEATNVDQVVATGVYYFANENVRPSSVSFRINVIYPVECLRDGEGSGIAALFGLVQQHRLAQPLGTIGTMEARCLAFPHALQRKINPVELSDPTRAGTCKRLTLYLVDPESPIPSAAVIPPQQQHWHAAVHAPLLEQLPFDEIAQAQIYEMARGRGTMTTADAQEHRAKMVQDHKRFWPRPETIPEDEGNHPFIDDEGVDAIYCMFEW
uniref:DUF4246 domain-containing protein n=1 Tax=Globisporangium ultimum (strain ATCC 200006 / CBS 805.95 / DAOM BR144) TaxID=431595 RepID=K3WJB2_GLOUD